MVLLGGLGYWRFVAINQNLESPKTSQSDQAVEPIEVPKTLPGASLEERVKTLEETVGKLVPSVNKSASSKSQSSSLDARVENAEAGVTELKARVSALEKATPSTTTTTSTSGKSTIYIPLGSGGQIESTNWTTLSSFQISLDPAQYPGYTSMQLEVTMRLNQPGGTLYTRLYNNTSSSVISSEATTTSTTATLVTTSTFTLPSGSKTYVLQAKTSDGTLGFLDYARIKVNF